LYNRKLGDIFLFYLRYLRDYSFNRNSMGKNAEGGIGLGYGGQIKIPASSPQGRPGCGKVNIKRR
jgi:hypothetical protein